MSFQLRRWLATPSFEDEIRAGRARLLNITTLSVLAIAITVPALARLFLNVQFPLTLVIGRLVPMMAAIVIARLLLFRRQVEFGSMVLVVFTWLVLAGNVISTAGLYAPSYFGFFLVILLAGFLIGARAALLTAGVSLLFGIVMLIVQQANPNLFARPDIAANWATGTVGFLVFGAFLYLVVEDYRGALDRIRASNEALLQARSESEEQVASRTRDLSIAAEIGQAVSQTRDLDRLLAKAVDLIWKGFDLYHAQIYLVDSAERNLIIRAGSGLVGQRLITQRHMLPLSSRSINTAAANQKQPVLVANTQESTLFRPNPMLPETRSEMAVPLIIAQEVLGVLNLQSSRPSGLSDADRPAMETLAAQLAVAIENARLFTELDRSRAALERQAQRMAQTGWQEFMDGISRSEAISRTYAGRRIQENGAVETSTSVAKETGTHLETIAVAGLPIGGIQIEPEHDGNLSGNEIELISAVARQVAQQVENLRLIGLAESYLHTAEEAVRRLTREAWTEQLAAREPAYQYDGQQVKEWDAESNPPPAGIVVPLSVRNEPVGEVVIEQVDHHPRTTAMTMAISERLSAHIENLRLAEQREAALRQTELHREELAAINRVAQAVSRQLELGQLLETIYTSVSQVIEVDTFIVFTYDATAGKMHYPYVYDQGRQYDIAPRDPEPTSQSFQVIQNGKPLLKLYSPEEVATFTKERQDHRITIGSDRVPASTIFVPLTVGPQTIGALSAQSYTYNAYNAQDVALLSGLASHVAVALDNARLFNETQQRAERERLVNEISQKILETNTVEAALHIAVRELGRAFKARQTLVELSEPGVAAKETETRPENGQHQPKKPINDGTTRS